MEKYIGAFSTDVPGWADRHDELLGEALMDDHRVEEPKSNPTGGLQKLQSYLDRIPAVQVVSASETSEALWWVKFDIDIRHSLAWNVVQELGHVLNYISLNERLPTVFKPVSPPPYMNGGPEDFLSWVIEAQEPDADAGYIAEVLEGHLPRPVEDEGEWESSQDEE
jgi:hypothetical protein